MGRRARGPSSRRPCRAESEFPRAAGARCLRRCGRGRPQDRPDATGEALVQVLGHPDGGFGVSRVPSMSMRTKESAASGALDHLADDALGQFGVEVHAHLRELHADVGVEFARGDGVEQSVIDRGRGAAPRPHLVRLSPSESRVTAMPSRLTRSQAASASSTVIPATKRLDHLFTSELCSAIPRPSFVCDNQMKRSKHPHLINS